jgi:hypothetical protein
LFNLQAGFLLLKVLDLLLRLYQLLLEFLHLVLLIAITTSEGSNLIFFRLDGLLENKSVLCEEVLILFQEFNLALVLL